MMAQRALQANNIRNQNIKTFRCNTIADLTFEKEYLRDVFDVCDGILCAKIPLTIFETLNFVPYYLYFTNICPVCGTRFFFAAPPWYCSICNVFLTKPLRIYHIAVRGGKEKPKVPIGRANLQLINGKIYVYIGGGLDG